MALSVRVLHGRRPGPTLFVSAAVHGDEILGVEIIRRLIGLAQLKRIRGTLIAVPIVNAYGFLGRTRYMPDGRDLNRSFPGSPEGSLAAQLGHLFMTSVVARCDTGIDLHTAAAHRVNLPQIRADLSSERVLALALAFGAPVVVGSNLRDGSLRQAAQDVGVDVLLYEAGEALRFDELSVRAGVRGVVSVMRAMGMLPERPAGSATAKSKPKPTISRSSHWLRAPAGGLFRATRGIGTSVEADQVMGFVSDPFGESEAEVRARAPGIIIGRTNLPVVNQGDALFHVAKVGNIENAENRVGRIEESLESDPLFDDVEIV